MCGAYGKIINKSISLNKVISPIGKRQTKKGGKEKKKDLLQFWGNNKEKKISKYHHYKKKRMRQKGLREKRTWGGTRKRRGY